MARSLGNLGDFFPDKDIRCRVRGCGNVWQFSGENALHEVALGKSARPERMCDECYAKFRTLADLEVPCSTPECARPRTWSRFDQLEAWAQGRSSARAGFCDACRQQLGQTADKDMPCRMKGCDGVWVWRRTDQMLHKTSSPPSRLCDTCYKRLKELQDQEIPCRMRGCVNTWAWGRYQQLEHIIAGKDSQTPPRYMCQDCFKAFRDLQDLDLPCRVRGCSHTWRFSRHDQLEYRLGHGAEAPTPSRMCAKCYGFFLKAEDRQIQCVHRGCANTWVYTKSMQLHDSVHGRTRPARRTCNECAEKIANGQDRAIPCMAPGCSGTWPYTIVDQVKDQCLGRTEPHPHRCKTCEEFLATHEVAALACADCGKDISWSVYEQLLCKLGTFAKPTRCTDCAEQKLALSKTKDATKLKHHHVVKMPATGAWKKHERISQWPPHLTHDTIDRVEKADVRIVALGDDLTYSAQNAEEAWPALLEANLSQTLKRRAKVAVVNAGIPRSTSHQALLRYPRDVAPFGPQLIIFSLTFADSLIWLNRKEKTWRPNMDPERMTGAMESLFRKLAASDSRVLYWIPNPVFPRDYVDTTTDPRYLAWAQEQEQARDHCLREARHLCTVHGIPMLDLHTRFVVNGVRSAKRWMADWYNHNAAGAQNIANWVGQYILQEELLPLKSRKRRAS